MIPRVLGPVAQDLARRMPVVAVTGPRQSGKTTLCRACFPDHQYVSLEPLDVRDFAVSDPRGFLRQHSGPVVVDEAQRAPALFSYLQGAVDDDPSPGRFILTGSQHFGLSEAISQSLAGRVGLLHLLPFSLDEARAAGLASDDPWTVVWTGGYPRIHDQRLPASEWLASYTATYVQRDVRQVLRVTDLDAFTALLRLAAARTGQELNLSGLGADVGLTHPTVRSWLSVLETSFVVFRLPPWLHNTRKRLVKAPKLHFVDSGLACHLLGIRDADQLRLHPLRGALFETWVASEVLKARLHRGTTAELYHLRETRGAEVDLLVDAGSRLLPVEVKSGATVASDALADLRSFRDTAAAAMRPRDVAPRLVYAGDDRQQRSAVDVVPWHQIQQVDWT